MKRVLSVITAWTALAAATMSATPGHAQAPEEVAIFGVTGSGPGQLSNPHGIAIDQSGNLYLADTDNNRIQVIRGSDGTFIRQWGSYGTAAGQFKSPWGLGIAPDGTVYVAEFWGNRIQHFSPHGDYLGQGPVSGNPRDVGVASSGYVYVAYGNGVAQFTSTGAFVGAWTTLDGITIDGTNGVAFNGAGNVLFTHSSGGYGVWEYTPGGQLVSRWGPYGTGPGAFGNYPNGLAIDGADHIFVVDTFNNRVEVFNSSGQFLLQWGSYGSSPGQFWRPWDIAVDSDGYSYVVDAANNRIQKFAPAFSGVTKLPSTTFGRLKATYR